MTWQRMPRLGWMLCFALAAGCGSDGEQAGVRRDDAASTAGEHRGPAEAAEGGSRERPNRPPEIDWIRFEPYSPLPGEKVRAVFRVEDPDGDRIEVGYVWRVGDRRIVGNASEITVPGEAVKGDLLEVRATVSDGSSLGAPAIASVAIDNRPPEWRELRIDPAPEVRPGSKVVIRADAVDPDGDPVEFDFRWYVNERRVENSGDSLETHGLRRGDAIRARVHASDGDDDAESRETATVRVGNAQPRIVSAPASAMEGGVFRYAVEADDPDGDLSLRYELASGPDGMSIDPVLGEVTWVPDDSQIGIHPVEVLVSDLHGGEARQVFEVTIGAPRGEAQRPTTAGRETAVPDGASGLP